MGLLQIILRQPHNCSDFSTFFDVWAITGRNLVCHCEPVNDVTLFKDSLRSQSVPLVLPWLPLWGSCHEVTERVKTPSPPPRGTSPIGRGKLPASVSHLRGTCEPPSPLGKAWKTDCDRRGLHQCYGTASQWPAFSIQKSRRQGLPPENIFRPYQAVGLGQG